MKTGQHDEGSSFKEAWALTKVAFVLGVAFCAVKAKYALEARRKTLESNTSKSLDADSFKDPEV